MRESPESRTPLDRSPRHLAAACVATTALMANLNALVDLVLHPEIAYLDEEHLIVGAVMALVTAGLTAWAASFIHRLQSAQRRIRDLESLLPICAHCKRIRTSERDRRDGAWIAIESYFIARDGVDFTHGVCPDCTRAHYPETVATT